MSYSRVLIDDYLHDKMKELSGGRRGALIEEYREALTKHIAEKTQKNISRDSGLEEYINNRVAKAEDHLASMLGRTGMDVSMTLMGLLMLLEKASNLDKNELYRKIRIEGARYFSTAIQNDKDRKKDNK